MLPVFEVCARNPVAVSPFDLLKLHSTIWAERRRQLLAVQLSKLPVVQYTIQEAPQYNLETADGWLSIIMY